jgi:hypothetical protein
MALPPSPRRRLSARRSPSKPQQHDPADEPWRWPSAEDGDDPAAPAAAAAAARTERPFESDGQRRDEGARRSWQSYLEEYEQQRARAEGEVSARDRAATAPAAAGRGGTGWLRSNAAAGAGAAAAGAARAALWSLGHWLTSHAAAAATTAPAAATATTTATTAAAASAATAATTAAAAATGAVAAGAAAATGVQLLDEVVTAAAELYVDTLYPIGTFVWWLTSLLLGLLAALARAALLPALRAGWRLAARGAREGWGRVQAARREAGAALPPIEGDLLSAAEVLSGAEAAGVQREPVAQQSPAAAAAAGPTAAGATPQPAAVAAAQAAAAAGQSTGPQQPATPPRPPPAREQTPTHAAAPQSPASPAAAAAAAATEDPESLASLGKRALARACAGAGAAAPLPLTLTAALAACGLSTPPTAAQPPQPPPSSSSQNAAPPRRPQALPALGPGAFAARLPVAPRAAALSFRVLPSAAAVGSFCAAAGRAAAAAAGGGGAMLGVRGAVVGVAPGWVARALPAWVQRGEEATGDTVSSLAVSSAGAAALSLPTQSHHQQQQHGLSRQGSHPLPPHFSPRTIAAVGCLVMEPPPDGATPLLEALPSFTWSERLRAAAAVAGACAALQDQPLVWLGDAQRLATAVLVSRRRPSVTPPAATQQEPAAAEEKDAASVVMTLNPWPLVTAPAAAAADDERNLSSIDGGALNTPAAAAAANAAGGFGALLLSLLTGAPPQPGQDRPDCGVLRCVLEAPGGAGSLIPTAPPAGGRAAASSTGAIPTALVARRGGGGGGGRVFSAPDSAGQDECLPSVADGLLRVALVCLEYASAEPRLPVSTPPLSQQEQEQQQQLPPPTPAGLTPRWLRGWGAAAGAARLFGGRLLGGSATPPPQQQPPHQAAPLGRAASSGGAGAAAFNWPGVERELSALAAEAAATEHLRASAAAIVATEGEQSGAGDVLSSVEEADEKPPELFLCPITYEVMKEPVILAGDGFCYEKGAISDWLARGARRSPMTGGSAVGVRLGGGWEAVGLETVCPSLNFISWSDETQNDAKQALP